MKIYKIFCVGTLMLFSLLAVNGIALAKDPLEMSDKESCEQEAKEAGMSAGAVSDKELQEFIAQCLKEIREEDKTDTKPSSGE